MRVDLKRQCGAAGEYVYANDSQYQIASCRRFLESSGKPRLPHFGSNGVPFSAAGAVSDSARMSRPLSAQLSHRMQRQYRAASPWG
ncbi:hypothetical protein [Neoroseomonas lacus]|uniref:hypothetical protein n=1 Tax=Neoroseomonas lacus TaxID=287609 RepID=UPI00166B056F|nr:hypothetical protein [Neoroseomonas lacus]